MISKNKVEVICGQERAIIYIEGGIEFSVKSGLLGYVVDEDPSDEIKSLALAVRREAYPRLTPLRMNDL